MAMATVVAMQTWVVRGKRLPSVESNFFRLDCSVEDHTAAHPDVSAGQTKGFRPR